MTILPLHYDDATGERRPLSRCNIVIDSSLTGTVDDWNPTGWDRADVLVLTTAGIISGFEADVTVKCKVIVNVSGSPVTLKNPAGSSSQAVNKFDIDADDWVIQDDNLVEIFHAGAAWSPFTRFPLVYAVNQIMMSRGDYPYYENVAVGSKRVVGNDGDALGLRPLTGAEVSTVEHTTKRITDSDSPYAVLATDRVLYCDTDGGVIEVDLPVGVDGRTLKLINVGSGANDLTVDPDAAESIFGAAAGVPATVTDGNSIEVTFEPTEGWW